MHRVELSAESNNIVESALTTVNETHQSNVGNNSYSYISRRNESHYPMEGEEFIFDRTDVKAIFITLYTIVFCCCFFGKLANRLSCL